MKPNLTAITAAFLLPMLLSTARAQCTRDTECKGSRVCESGSSVPHAPALTRAASPRPWYRGYGSLGLALGATGWGEFRVKGHDGSVDATYGVAPGVHFSGYFAPSQHFHVGGFFSYGNSGGRMTDGNASFDFDVSRLGAGVALKVGGKLSSRVWLGLGMDAGIQVLDPPAEGESLHGLLLFPRLHLDVVAVDAGGFKMGLYAGIGPLIVPYAATDVMGETLWTWSVDVAMLLGLTFGG